MEEEKAPGHNLTESGSKAGTENNNNAQYPRVITPALSRQPESCVRRAGRARGHGVHLGSSDVGRRVVSADREDDSHR